MHFFKFDHLKIKLQILELFQSTKFRALPFLLLVGLLYSTPVYWLVGLRKDIDGFLYFSLVVWLVLLMSNSLVACFSALVPNFILGTSVIAGLMGSFFLFSGYFISEEKIPSYWIFMHYLSLFKYPFECLMINEYGGEQGKMRCLEINNGKCILYGVEFLRQQGLRDSQKWTNLAVMLSFIVGYRVLSFIILWFRCYRTRKQIRFTTDLGTRYSPSTDFHLIFFFINDNAQFILTRGKNLSLFVPIKTRLSILF